jgi:hypothetical protein
MSSNEETRRGGRRRRCHRRCWKFPFIILAVVLIKSGLVLLLWNALVPGTFGGPVLNYLQALELTVLATLLMGFGRPRGPFGGPFGGGRLREKWMHMSSEEREKLREEMRRRYRGEERS